VVSGADRSLRNIIVLRKGGDLNKLLLSILTSKNKSIIMIFCWKGEKVICIGIMVGGWDLDGCS
jgi:hypothetical protein